MNIVFLNKWRVISENILSDDELNEFVIKYELRKFGTAEIILLFEYFYKIDINEYTISDIIFDGSIIRVNLKDEDIIRIRERKINTILSE